jgi:hypothetical protein
MLVNPQRRPARPASRSVTVDPPTLLQFVLLSMLLHALLIVLFGNPVGGSARRSEGWWGPLDVTLGRLSPEPGSGFRLAPGAETSARGASLRRRSAGAADMNRLQRVPEPADASQPAQEAAPAAEEAATPAQPAPAQALPRLNRTAPEEVDRPLTPSVVSPAKIERIAPARIERELALPLELPPRAVPMAPAAPLERVAPPQIERDVAPPVELPPRAVPMAPTAPIEPVAPARIERELAPAVEVPAPRIVPGDTAPPAERAAPPVAPARPQAQPAAPSPPLRFGTPDADEEIFKPRRDTGTPPAEAPRIDLDAARKKAAREVVSEGSGSRGVFTIPSPPPPEKKTKEAMAMEKALKPDCRTAYASMGLLAVPALVASAIAADGSCRW